jgi:hypothetical protein
VLPSGDVPISPVYSIVHSDNVTVDKDGRRIAIEVELTLKKPQELWLKVLRLSDTKEWASLEQAYQSIWFYVASKQIQAALQEQIGRLPAADQQRFAVSVVDWL